MLDLQFADTIAAALGAAMISVQDGDSAPNQDRPDYVQRICRRAALQLLFDLDGKSLLDLALAKLSLERGREFERAA